jgi:hypothetical protein
MLLVSNGYMTDQDENSSDGPTTNLHQPTQVRERHEHFLQALQRLPAQAGEDWAVHLAGELHWSVEEVEEHAFRYLVLLSETDRDGTIESSMNGGRANGHHQRARGLPWSVEDNILLDALLAQYRPSEATVGVPDWADRIAQMFPGRTGADVRRRCRQLERENALREGF